MLTEAEQYLANLGYSGYNYSPSAGVESTWVDIPDQYVAQANTFPVYDQPLTFTAPAPEVPPVAVSSPTGTPVIDWPWEKEYWQENFGFLQDPLGPIDDIFKAPGNIIGGAIGGVMNLAQILPLMMLMGGKMDFKKIMLMMLMSGGIGALGGLFGGSSNDSGSLMSTGSSDPFGSTSGGIDPMMAMLMMGGSGRQSNQLMKTALVAPALGIGAGAAMMLGMVTGNDTPPRRRRTYRRRYNNGGSYQAGFNRGLAAGK